MDLGLKNKVAMVGGASKGLGFAIARALAAEGARVSIASRDGAAIERAAVAITQETGGHAFAVAADLSKAEAIAEWHAATIAQFGGIDLLFANTGGPPAGTALSFDDGAWQAAFDLLLMSVIRAVRLVVPSMRARGGGAILVGTSSSVKEPIVERVALGGDVAGQDAVAGARAGQDPREHAHPWPDRHRSPAPARRDQRQEGRRHACGSAGAHRVGDPARTLRRAGGLRPRRRVSAFRPGVLHHRRVGAGRRRPDKGFVVIKNSEFGI